MAVVEYEFKLDWVRIDNVSEDSADSVGELFGRIRIDGAYLWPPTWTNVLGGTETSDQNISVNDFLYLNRIPQTSYRVFDEQSPGQASGFDLLIQISEKDDWNPNDVIADVHETVRPNPADFKEAKAVSFEKTAAKDGKITYHYTLTRNP
ncbi:hypothetical protein [Streptomyces venezuelae]|uniref:hypothetical protein n=1 Tax=Streptomyces venezuelae TaxID=54571 RepID=UPI003650F06A